MRISEIDMVSPKTLADYMEFLMADVRSQRIIAGGTDAVVRMKDGKWSPEVWVNIKGIAELRYIREEENWIDIGPLTTHSDIVGSPLLCHHADVLVQASASVGATQIRNMGTLGGNLATASPAGDTIPALYVLGAELELMSKFEKRKIPIELFFHGPGKTDLKTGELITNIVIPKRQPHQIGIFEKLGPRKAQAISIINVAILLYMENSGRKCMDGKIAFGSVAPTVVRARNCESMLSLTPLNAEVIDCIGQAAWSEVSPISDIRASATYRREMATALLRRGLYRLMKRWDER